LENLRRQYPFLQETEAHLSKERDVLNCEKHSQGILLANLEYIITSLEGSTTEQEIRLETRLDESLSGCGVLSRRLQETQVRLFHICYWDRQLEAADKRQDVEDWTYWKVRPPAKWKK
jgi:hypothetical protein